MNDKNRLTTADFFQPTILADKNLSSDMKSADFFRRPTFVGRLLALSNFLGWLRWKAAD